MPLQEDNQAVKVSHARWPGSEQNSYLQGGCLSPLTIVTPKTTIIHILQRLHHSAYKKNTFC